MSFADLVFPKAKNGAETALLVWIIDMAALFPDSITCNCPVFVPTVLDAECLLSILPPESMRTFSVPTVSNEIVSFAGNLIAVFVSPV